MSMNGHPPKKSGPAIISLPPPEKKNMPKPPDIQILREDRHLDGWTLTGFVLGWLFGASK